MLKLILAIITVLMFLERIKNTGNMLNEKKYKEMVAETINKRMEKEDQTLHKRVYPDEIERKAYQIMYKIISALFCIYYVIVYALFYKNLLVLVLSVMQIITVIATLEIQMKIDPLSNDISEYKFHRWYYLFNVTLDYIYYPLMLYMLFMGQK